MFGSSKSAGAARLQIFSPALLGRERRTANEAMIRALCANAYIGGSTSLCRVLGRYKMYVDTQDIGLSVHLMLEGYWEMWLTEALAHVLKPGMVAVDVGANLGYFSVLMADLVGPAGYVHAFEPNPAIAARLRMTAKSNGFATRLAVHQIGLGDEEGATFRLVIPDNEPKNGFMVSADGDQPGDLVTIRRLDGFEELLDADVIKIDADTSELAIWRGMRGIFDRGRPLIIFLEFNPVRYEEPLQFLKSILAEGFSITRVDLVVGLRPVTVDDVLTFAPGEDQMLMIRR